MRDGEPGTIRTLLDRLLAARARRDGEERFSPRWRAADNDMREIEVAIFRFPLDPPRPLRKGQALATRGRRALTS